jgi:hypothetical protein
LTLTITDVWGNLIASLTASARQPPVTANVYLLAGTCRVRYRAAGAAAFAPLTYWLAGDLLSDPFGRLRNLRLRLVRGIGVCVYWLA